MTLKNKRILITAGPTWVPIDSVRVISNVATGKTGILLAEKLKNLGAKVTLLLGPVETGCLSKEIRLIRFKFFDELKNTLIEELKSRKYDIVVHSAAVSDYKPIKRYPHKISSQHRNFLLRLKPTVKIIDLIKKMNNSLFIVAFKFESGLYKERLIQEARKFFKKYSCNIVVANIISNKRYIAYILDQTSMYGPIFNKERLAKFLINVTSRNLK